LQAFTPAEYSSSGMGIAILSPLTHGWGSCDNGISQTLETVCAKDYKVVLLNLKICYKDKLVRTGVKVFTLGDNVWRDIDCFPLVIWQMKEFGVEESWTQLLKISYLLDLNIGFDVYYYYNMSLIPLCFSDDDALIFVPNFGDDPILYDWRNNRVKRIKITNFGDKTIQYDWYSAKEYSVESLVSTC
jgi:hypothetical protein